MGILRANGGGRPTAMAGPDSTLTIHDLKTL